MRQVVVLVTGLMLLTGCAGMTTTAPDAVPDGATGAMSGHVHGGQQSIAFATVQIWSAGSTGYGSQGTLFATATTANDGFGTFSFTKAANTDTPYTNTGSTWACPASTNPFMYLVAKGGNTQGTGSTSTVNTGAAFLLAIGQCSTITSASYYALNEVTSVGSMAALTQYFSPVTETIGAPSTTQAQQGLANAFAVIPNLVNIGTGVAMGRVSHTYVYGLAETPKMNTIADVLAACINSPSLPSATCTTLFTNAYPPAPAVTSQPGATFATATDTLQALWYMLANPGDSSATRVGALYGLVSGLAPFQPTTGGAPTDWNVGITYYSVPGAAPCGSPAISNPGKVAINSLGDVYVVETQSTFSGFYELTPGGNLQECDSFSTLEARDLALDTRGYFWFTLDSGAVINTNSGLGSFTSPVTPYAIVADGSGDIFYTAKASGAVYEIPSASVLAPGQGPKPASTLIGTLPSIPYTMVADASGNLWAACADSNIYELVKASGYAVSVVVASPGYPGGITSMSVNSAGEVLFPNYIAASSAYNIGHITGSPGAYNVTYTTGSFADNEVITDGAGNLWTANEGSYGLSGVNSGFVFESSKAGAALIPPYGITKPANSSEFSSTLVQNEVVMGTVGGIAIDPSGNVWTVNSFTNMFNTTDGQQSTITELVGAAVPVVTPIAVGLANGTVGTKP